MAMIVTMRRAPSAWLRIVQAPSTSIARTCRRCHHRWLTTAAPPLPQPVDYDVCIVGGGLVGSTLAALLRHSPITRRLNVAVIEPSPTPPPLTQSAAIGASGGPPLVRVVSITPASHQLFREIGILDRMDTSRIAAFDQMRVYQSDTALGQIHWKAHEIQSSLSLAQSMPVLGYTIENDLLVRALHGYIDDSHRQSLANAQSKPWIDASKHSEGAIDLIQGAKVASVTLPSSPLAAASTPPIVTLSDGRTIQCKLLIGSDGSNSQVRQATEFGDIGFDYHQHAVVASLSLQSSLNSTAWQKFLPSGPIALLPCHSGYASMVWSTTPAHAKHLLSLEPHQFVNEVNRAFQSSNDSDSVNKEDSLLHRLLPGPIRRSLPVLFPRPEPATPPLIASVVSKRMTFPLKFSTPLHYVKPRCVLMGDAAHVCHPLAGQGVNLGIADAESLARIIETSLLNGGDCSSLVNVLEVYERERRGANVLSIAGIDALQRIFGTNTGPVSWLRGLAMELFNASATLKYRAATQAMHGQQCSRLTYKL